MKRDMHGLRRATDYRRLRALRTDFHVGPSDRVPTYCKQGCRTEDLRRQELDRHHGGAAYIVACLGVVLLLTHDATAQTSQTTFDESGRVSGHTITGSDGAVTYYGADGKVSGRSTTSNGTTTFYDASGRKAGSVTKPHNSKSTMRNDTNTKDGAQGRGGNQ
jgi:YD repeat-containing protein